MKCEYCREELELGEHTEHGEYCKMCYGPAPERPSAWEAQNFAMEMKFNLMATKAAASAGYGGSGGGGTLTNWSIR